MTLDIVIWSIFIGIVLGAFYTYYIKSILGSFVRRLLAEEAFTPQTAKKLDQMGFAKNIIIRHALRDKSPIRKIVKAAAPADGEGSSAPRFDPLAARFYIPEELRYRADIMFDAKGSSLPVAIIAVLAFFVAALISFAVIPDLVQMAKNAISSF